MTSFAQQLDFLKDFCLISFSLINGCVIENALCSDIICSRTALRRDPRDGTIPLSTYNKIFFFPPFFYFLTMARERRTNHLGPKNKTSYCETK